MRVVVQTLSFKNLSLSARKSMHFYVTVLYNLRERSIPCALYAANLPDSFLPKSVEYVYREGRYILYCPRNYTLSPRSNVVQ